jgi:hypothetical protein
MTDRTPIETTNLDIYGNAELPWSRPRDLLANSSSGVDNTFFLGTVSANGIPHAAGIGAMWHDGEFYIVSGPNTRKSRNLAENPNCTISIKLQGIDLVFEGKASRITDKPTLERVARLYRDIGGWPAEVKDDAFTAPYSAPSAGPPPWYVYQFNYHTVYGVATAEPNGATRWRFAH